MRSFSRPFQIGSQDEIFSHQKVRDVHKEVFGKHDSNQHILQSQKTQTRDRELEKIKIHELGYKYDDEIVNVDVNPLFSNKDHGNFYDEGGHSIGWPPSKAAGLILGLPSMIPPIQEEDIKQSMLGLRSNNSGQPADSMQDTLCGDL